MFLISKIFLSFLFETSFNSKGKGGKKKKKKKTQLQPQGLGFIQSKKLLNWIFWMVHWWVLGHSSLS